MKVVVNGKAMELDNGLSIAQLLDRLGIEPQGIAVEVNKEVVPKSQHEKVFLRADDKIEIVQMVGGG